MQLGGDLVKVNFPDRVWARLATIAERREVSIADLLVEAAQGLLAVKQPTVAPTPAPVVHPNFDPADPAVQATVREMYALHRSRQEIADHFGVPYQPVRTLCDHLGLKPRRHVRPKQVDEDWFRELYDLHWSDVEIAARMGVADVTVGRVRRRLGLPTVGQHGRQSTTNPKESN